MIASRSPGRAKRPKHCSDRNNQLAGISTGLGASRPIGPQTACAANNLTGGASPSRGAQNSGRPRAADDAQDPAVAGRAYPHLGEVRHDVCPGCQGLRGRRRRNRPDFAFLHNVFPRLVVLTLVGACREAHGIPYFFSASLRPPIAFWTLPATLSALPSDCSLASPTALPMVSLTEPLISFAAPAIRSLSMTTFSYDGHKFRSSRRPYRDGAGCGRLGKYSASLSLRQNSSR